MSTRVANANSPHLPLIYRHKDDNTVQSVEYALRKVVKCLYMYVGKTPNTGYGIFAAKAFHRGDIIMADEDGDYFDRVLSHRELRELGYPIAFTLQVGIDAFKLPTGSLEDFTNHSCDPNTGIRLTERGTVVLALRDIAPHEELTYDYSTYLNNPYESMRCLCGAPTCRGVVGNFSALPDALKRRYLALGIVGAFAQEPLPHSDAAD